jgi:hypothetical protein
MSHDTETLQNRNGHQVPLCLHLLPARTRTKLHRKLRTKHPRLARLVAQPVATVPMVVDDLCAEVEVRSYTEHHYLEAGHWTNHSWQEYEVDPDTATVTEDCFAISLPWVERLLGTPLHDSLCEWLCERNMGWLHDHVQEYVEQNASDFEWAY